MADQELDERDRLVREPDALHHLHRHPHAFFGVVVIAPLADVVEEQRQDQQFRMRQIREQRAEALAARDGARREALEPADRQQRVLVDGVLVVEVAHDATEDRLELGKHPSEQSAVVHLRQPRVKSRARLQKRQQRRLLGGARKELLRTAALDALLDPRQRFVRDRRAGVDGGLKQRQPAFRLDARPIRVDEPDAIARLHEIDGHRHGRGLLHPSKRSADRARVTEVVAHQALDPLPRRALVSHPLGGLLLSLVGQLVPVAFVLGVQNRSHAQQEFLGFVETGAIGRTAIDKHRIGERRDRPRGPEIAQRAGRVLDVGF